MQENARALRRHHAVRVKEATVAFGRRVLYRDKGETQADYDLRLRAWAGRTCQNRRSCSCAMCGNPRRSPLTKGKVRLTLAERRAQDALRDQIASPTSP